MPKRMRKGTRSCLPCRCRKVRCSYTSDSKFCVNCAKRGESCVPQGDIQTDCGGAQLASEHTEHKDVPNSHLSFFNALDQLRQWVQLPHSSAISTLLPPISGADTELRQAVNDPRIIQSEDAPVMKLFNNLRMGRTIHIASNGDTCLVPDSRQNADHNESSKAALVQMLLVLPSDAEIQSIFQSRSRWWETWRQSFGLGWGESEDKTLESFATRAICTANPSLLGSLLVCFALSSGDHDRYLKSVEKWIMNENNFTGLCLLSALQPSRAWSVFRTAITRLQLAGIHKTHRKSASLDAAFWQIFGADRWVSLMLGLPYSVPDHLCDLKVAEVTQSSYISFHYQHLTILTGRVIDVLQSDQPISLSKLITVEESIDNITAQLPPHYLDLGETSSYVDEPDKSARLYRLTHIHQLKTFLYLPVFLKACEKKDGRLKQGGGDEYGKLACTNSARAFLNAFLALFDLDPGTASVDNSIKLTAFTALSSAAVLYLNGMSCNRGLTPQREQSSHSTESDMALVFRSISVLQICSEGRQDSLCGQCHRALVELTSCGSAIHESGSRQVPVPYFGIITITRRPEAEALRGNETRSDTQSRPQLAPNAQDLPIDNTDGISPFLFDDMVFLYQGPWETPGVGFDWPNQEVDINSCGYGLTNFATT
ncbi:hypothetical protein BDV26DRAFT_299935 [Aspergillus bertholletiae]|uniref:Zn(2)-C6 fungal-type domain-containing protein n=1 Tax=Aspergillus bertholletiae TaxID=1226010 RepID=A0A5N7B1E8_9EURO|nr:hypothetical protein BDV26DRAFT_299935 [Aspergillus bertholletiae]